MSVLLALISEANARGLWVNNLFQIGLLSPAWRANLTDGINCWAFAIGTTPEEALALALANTGKGPGVPILGAVPVQPSAEDLGL